MRNKKYFCFFLFQLALKFHPDKNQGNEEAEAKVSSIFIKV